MSPRAGQQLLFVLLRERGRLAEDQVFGAGRVQVVDGLQGGEGGGAGGGEEGEGGEDGGFGVVV